MSEFVTFLISLIVLVGVGIVLRVQPTLYVFQAVIPLLILFVFTFGCSMILSTMNVFFRDIEYIWSVFTFLLHYASAIFYQPDRIISTGNGWVFDVNPVYMCIANFRNTILYGTAVDWNYCMVSGTIALVTFVLGVLLFVREQDKFILYV